MPYYKEEETAKDAKAPRITVGALPYFLASLAPWRFNL
jgi:hypothetical protein